MKKIITITAFLVTIQSSSCAQDLNATSQWHRDIVYGLDTARQGTSRALLIVELASYYKFYMPDSALFYGYKALALSRQIRFPKGEVRALGTIALSQSILGNDSKALQITLQGLKIAEKNKLMYEKAILLIGLANFYNSIKDNAKALELYTASKLLCDMLHDATYSALNQNFIGETYLLQNRLDSALYNCQAAYKTAAQANTRWLMHEVLLRLGRIEQKKGNNDSALHYFQQSLSLAEEVNSIFNSYFSIAQLYQQMEMPDSSIFYAKKALQLVRKRGFYPNIINVNTLLSGIYEKKEPSTALAYSKMAIAYKDSLYNLGKSTASESFLAYDEQERQYEIETAETAYRNRVKQYALIAALVTLVLIAYMLYNHNRHRKKAYALLQQQKQETDMQKTKVEQALQGLKATQSQLVQSEKMASLGELTAGIAHEIQNPLNFVNNFSEVNKELIEELKNQKSKLKSEELDDLLNDIADNEQKINLHGKRADAIVKGMLQHTRTNTGKREPTDINALADEYLRLSYHGFRAKDKSFNATIETNFDESLDRIDIIPQDVGRVLLNLFNNAFYSVNEKKKQLDGTFEPVVSVSTERSGDSVQIHVRDNGTGIPPRVVDKIFQPFFTTKPTGQGTGLGLSLSYDIIKAHGGEIEVETKDSEGSEFIIQLPLQT